MSAPTLEELLQRSQRALLESMFVTLPARVERYDAERQCVDAQPLPMRMVRLEDGSEVARPLPVVRAAPVVFPGSGPYRDTFPIAVGSVVILHYTSAALDRWLSIGGVTEPGSGRRHDGSSAFAVPGGHSFGGPSSPTTTAPEDARVLHGALTKVASPDASDPVARKSDLDAVVAKLNAVIAAHNAHTHILTLTVGTGTAAVTTTTATSCADQACSDALLVP